MGCGQSTTAYSESQRLRDKNAAKDEIQRKPKSTYANFMSSHNARLQIEKESKIRGATFLSNGFLVATDYHNNSLKLFDSQFKYTSNMEFSSAPWDVCEAKDSANTILATVPYTKQVHRISLVTVGNKTNLEDTGSFRTEGFCWGITCFDGGIAVSVKVATPTNVWPKPPEYQVHVHEYDGTFRRAIVYDPNGSAFFVEPKYLNVTYDDMFLLVSDYKLNTVFCINNEDELIFAYAGMQNPNGIAMDENKDLHVTSFFGAQRVHKVGANGKYKDGLPHDESRPVFPHCVCYRKKDRIIVLTTEQSLEVYKLVY
ncbi:uncharacterized protein LOC127845102 [Dreissena polymorpha]|uniref:Uncharacterized protein n=1 Tax=Dreissena polymorpha TaxID=45954 RepID=A0A9D4E493_DREPO|nr:uncharacterized protein LOC127845102 [Dreissena polymorpha]KAH3773589.1 hypothetical protein DPMN_174951 [Dreissena polymorpha]